MTDEMIILEKMLDAMSGVMNVLPKETVYLKESDTLIILQRRFQESDLKRELALFNAVFANNDGVEIRDLCQCAVSYVKIKVLVEARTFDFDPKLIRVLDREFKSQKTKVENIIHLMRVNAMTADAYQKEKIELTLKKNEAFYAAYEEEISKLLLRMEKEPELFTTKEDIKELKPVEVPVKKEKKETPISLMAGVINAKKNQREVEERLKEEERLGAKTMCMEIPFYDKTLLFSECMVCKDIPVYAIFKRKNNVFFGLLKNASKGIYNNIDQSLVELTQVTTEFLQFLSEDLLSGDYKLKPFTRDEKRSLQMYFNFVSYIFEKNIGVTLTVMEYMEFKRYYNRLIMTMFDLEEKFHKDYYRALTLADTYTSYMECYGLSYFKEKKQMVKNIMEEKSRNYVDDLELIMSHHIVDKKAKDRVLELIQRMKYFSDDKLFETNGGFEEPKMMEEVPKRMLSGTIDPTPNSLDPALSFFAQDYNDGVVVTAEDISNVQIKIQFQNKDHVIVDEALFSAGNIKQAVYDYLTRTAYIKKIGLYMNEKEVFLYSSKNASLSVAVLTEQMKRIKQLDRGVQGQLIEFYEEKIKKHMLEYAQ